LDLARGRALRHDTPGSASRCRQFEIVAAAFDHSGENCLAERNAAVPSRDLCIGKEDEVARITGLPAALPGGLPPWQIVRERRATFSATPAQDAKRPGPATGWRNLILAGDWTDTGLPATIEGAIRSGNRAAEIIAKLQ